MSNVSPLEPPLDPSEDPNDLVTSAAAIIEEVTEVTESSPEDIENPKDDFEDFQEESTNPVFQQFDLLDPQESAITISLKQKVEAVLYLKGQPMNLAAIAETLGCEVEDAEMGLIDLISEYAHRDSALEIVETDTGFALRLRSEFADLVHKLIPVDLGRGALRTLAAIALKKNIVQSELIELRGAGAYQHVQELVEQGFVKKKRQAEGRSSVLYVTPKFHQYFEIDDLTKLI